MSSTNGKYDFSEKVALVTGSSSGIGAAIAVQFAQYGAKVTITGRNAENLDNVASKIAEVSNGVEALQIIGDLTIDDSLPKRLIDETVTKFGRLDFLVNNAGGSTPNGKLTSTNLLEEFDQVYKLNVRSIVELTQLAVPYLEETKGNIINISSITAFVPFNLIYGSAKAALDMITKTSAKELGPKGIRVNSINPGPVVTGFGRSLGVENDKYYEFLEQFERETLMKRIGKPEDIANLASFLASDEAINITGSLMVSDNGTLVYSPKFEI
ncbi:hypothetical protein RDWZM_008351 [Blomia tropicalis]|uniref:Uncharacterized protein n=1 Tax=Blomia tropicalis TaxID=40697 RepID=A0A9Q0RJX6_BLOTA|nr:hypothetical protein RDWZM_008351 [Blomia tropicalis]